MSENHLTPRTNVKAVFPHGEQIYHETIPADIYRQIERDLNEALEALRLFWNFSLSRASKNGEIIYNDAMSKTEAILTRLGK